MASTQTIGSVIMRYRFAVVGLIALFGGCERREQVLTKNELEGTALQNLPDVSGSASGHSTSNADPLQSAAGGDPFASTAVDPTTLALAHEDSGAARAADWERLSVLSLGLETRDGNLDFARLSTEESKRATPLQKAIQAGLNALNQGKLTEASEQFDAAKKADPRDFRPYFFDAVVQLQQQYKDEADRKAAAARAKAEFDIAIRLAPQESELYLHRGNLRLREGEYGLAVDDFTRVLEAHPEHLGALMNRAAANFHRRRPKDIVADTSTIIKLRPGIADAHLLRALGYLMQGETTLGRRDFDAAVAAGLAKPAVESWQPYFRRS